MNLEKLYKVLKENRNGMGLSWASSGTLYRRIWVRDNFYCTLPYLKTNKEYYQQTYHGLLDYYRNVENKYGRISKVIENPNPKDKSNFIHPRMTEDLDEIQEEWGNRQYDTIGEVLFGIVLGEKENIHIIRDDIDRDIINKLIKVLASVEYWQTEDNGVWEEQMKLNASSIGACLSGLKAVREIGFDVPQYLIDNGYAMLNKLLPKESWNRDCDLALLTLIYPFSIVGDDMAKQIIHNVEEKLLRERGIARYVGDRYYNCSDKWFCDKNHWWFDNSRPQVFQGSEAEWAMGLSFLSLAYVQIGNKEKAEYYLKQLSEKCCFDECKIPELFYSKQDFSNPNNPLYWSIAMAILNMEVLGYENI